MSSFCFFVNDLSARTSAFRLSLICSGFFLVFIEKALEVEGAVVVWMIDGGVGLIVFGDLEGFEADNLALILDEHPIDGMTAVAY